MFNFSDNLHRDIVVISRHMAAYLAKKIEPLGIGVGQYPYLFVLYINDGQSQQELSNRLLLDKAATVRSINKLVEAGYVERISNPHDNRCFKIFLTEKGRSVRPQLESLLTEVIGILNKGLSDQEQATARKIFRRMLINITQVTREFKEKC